MKLLNKNIIFSLTVVLIAALLVFSKVSAQEEEFTQDRINAILSSCASATNTLDQLHASDALLRVNMGQEYESVLTKLMTGFNGRVSNNGFSNEKLKSISVSYGNTLNKFRVDYIAYEEKLSYAMRINCKKQPTVLYDAIAQAREYRTKLHDSVIKLNDYIDQYRSEISRFETEYQSNKTGTK